MKPSSHNTRIVATIGPASRSLEMLEELIRAGMNVARLNFSHGDFNGHAEVIERIRAVSRKLGVRVAIMADLPGPKMRLGEIAPGPVELSPGDPYTLTSRNVTGNASIASMTFEPLPRVVKPGDRLFLNDGLVQLLVQKVEGCDVECTVAVGGMVSSRKGLNLPRIALGISAFTARDRECLEFALGCGVDAVSQSFVESAADIEAVRSAADELGHRPFIVAKIERFEAVERYGEILKAADGIMVARGDLGVEVPIEEMAMIQKRLIALANQFGKPVITATQMLESMTASRLPTRAEATDVANAILDGTDCVMLSGESAVGSFPIESVAMLAAIARASESRRESPGSRAVRSEFADPASAGLDPKALLVRHTIDLIGCDAVLAPTSSGRTARRVASAHPPVRVFAVSTNEATLHELCFTSGVHPVSFSELDLDEEPELWNDAARRLVEKFKLPCKHILLVSGPSLRAPDKNQRFELIKI